MANLDLLINLWQMAEIAFNGIDYYALSVEQRQDSFYGAVVGQAKMLVVGIANSLNVDEEIVVPARIKHFGQLLDLLETVFARIEANVAEVNAG